jgi:thioredoxin reductase (NADPH)
MHHCGLLSILYLKSLILFMQSCEKTDFGVRMASSKLHTLAQGSTRRTTKKKRMTDPSTYDVIVIGGGPAGLTAALYTTRLGHDTALVNREGGRYESVNRVHNLIGISKETRGSEITDLALDQLQEYGADHHLASVDSIHKERAEREFRVEGDSLDLLADRVVLATGIRDRPPTLGGLKEYTGHGLHYCLHCDAFDLVDEPTFMFGHSGEAATAAMILLNFTGDVDLLLNGESPTWDKETARQLRAHPVNIIETEAINVNPDDPDTETPWIGSIDFADGTTREYTGGFAMYGSDHSARLARELGCDLKEDESIAVDDHGHTSVDGIYAVGDVTPGHNQTPVAIGDGAKAGIAVHKEIRTYPIPVEELDEREELAKRDLPALSEGLREQVQTGSTTEEHSGMTPKADD